MPVGSPLILIEFYTSSSYLNKSSFFLSKDTAVYGLSLYAGEFALNLCLAGFKSSLQLWFCKFKLLRFSKSSSFQNLFSYIFISLQIPTSQSHSYFTFSISFFRFTIFYSSSKIVRSLSSNCSFNWYMSPYGELFMASYWSFRFSSCSLLISERSWRLELLPPFWLMSRTIYSISLFISSIICFKFVFSVMRSSTYLSILNPLLPV